MKKLDETTALEDDGSTVGLGISDRLRDWIPAGDGYNSEYAEMLTEAADEIDRLYEALEQAAEVARNACEGWNDALMHEGARMAADAVQALLRPNVRDSES